MARRTAFKKSQINFIGIKQKKSSELTNGALDKSPARMKVKQTNGPQEPGGWTEEQRSGLDGAVSTSELGIKKIHKYFHCLY